MSDSEILYDKDIREPLFDFLEETYGKIRIIEEKNIDGKADFYVLREPKDNPKVDRQRKIMLLWRPELAHLLEINKLPKYKEKSKAFVQEKLLEKVPDEILWEQAYEELFQRDYNTIGQRIAEYKEANRKFYGKDEQE